MFRHRAGIRFESPDKLKANITIPLVAPDPPPLNESSSSRESCRAPNHEPFFDSIGQTRKISD